MEVGGGGGSNFAKFIFTTILNGVNSKRLCSLGAILLFQS